MVDMVRSIQRIRGQCPLHRVGRSDNTWLLQVSTRYEAGRSGFGAGFVLPRLLFMQVEGGSVLLERSQSAYTASERWAYLPPGEICSINYLQNVANFERLTQFWAGQFQVLTGVVVKHCAYMHLKYSTRISENQMLPLPAYRMREKCWGRWVDGWMPSEASNVPIHPQWINPVFRYLWQVIVCITITLLCGACTSNRCKTKT